MIEFDLTDYTLIVANFDPLGYDGNIKPSRKKQKILTGVNLQGLAYIASNATSLGCKASMAELQEIAAMVCMVMPELLLPCLECSFFLCLDAWKRKEKKRKKAS